MIAAWSEQLQETKGLRMNLGSGGTCQLRGAMDVAMVVTLHTWLHGSRKTSSARLLSAHAVVRTCTKWRSLSTICTTEWSSKLKATL